MASLIPGYEYDIFISYRQKDNKYDSWVTEFVDNLKRELEATFKEEISVYFDINPHDGLLETHDVDASLKEKLKCLVFIPIISRTYCDPKSFAWEHEFRAFIDQSSKDQFGLKVKLPNGNVANRVLPVRIHELDAEDIKLCESSLGSVLRGVEFIYNSAGVNRPLRSKEDKPHDNLNKTIYRDQINKVANAIKEIISGLRAGEAISGKEKTESRMPWEEIKKEKVISVLERPSGFNRRRLMSGIIPVIIILMLLVIYVYPKIFKQDNLKSSDKRISVAVMPFQNMTNDTTWNIWQDGIQTILITSLTNSEDLKVRQLESTTILLQSKGLTNYASLTPSVASDISQKLDASVFICGGIIQASNAIRVNAQIFDSKKGEALKSFQIDGTAKNILHIIDSLSVMVKNYLIMSKLGKAEPYSDHYPPLVTNSPEAYRYLIYGNKAFAKVDYATAIEMYMQAIKIDSNIYEAYTNIASAYFIMSRIDQGEKWLLKYYSKLDQMNMREKLMANYLYAYYLKSPYEALRYLEEMIYLDDQSPNDINSLGDIYLQLHQYDKALPEFEKALEIYHRWGMKPTAVFAYTGLGYLYHKKGQYKKEKKLYKKAEQDFPDNYFVLRSQFVLSLNEGDTAAANKYIDKYISICKGHSDSEASIADDLASYYWEAGILDKAEGYFRQALSLTPENERLMHMRQLARFLIDTDRNITEGLDLIDKALNNARVKLSPNYFIYLDIKGCGLYKQGKNKEALEFLEKADSLKPVYDYELYLQLEEVKKTIDSQKNN